MATLIAPIASVSVSSSRAALLAALSDAVEPLLGANEYLSVGNGGRTQRIVVKRIFGQHLKCRTGLDTTVVPSSLVM